MPRIPRCPHSVPYREEMAEDLRVAEPATDRADPREETIIRIMDSTIVETRLHHRLVHRLSR